ncbi:hypothetical protein [Streptomyces ramulosus]|uniref:hypothetical protein n=1 Tax=Streptomyces TaxID=1883 RepID=UPI0031EC2760
MNAADHTVQIERATAAAKDASDRLVDAVIEASTLPPAAAMDVLEAIGNLTAALEVHDARTRELFPTALALAEMRRLVRAEFDAARTDTGAARRRGRARSHRRAAGPQTPEEWAARGETAIAERVWFYDRAVARDPSGEQAAERAQFMALPIAAKNEALTRRREGTPWPVLLNELTARHQ